MQQPHNQLKEIIWEITDNCHQGCTYCGSKDSINKTKINNEDIHNIIKEIHKYPPQEINISGGNPLLVEFSLHEYLVNTLKDKGVICKILINPFNYTGGIMSELILSLYDWVGISINNKEELRNASLINNFSKKTIITNFNTSNIFLFDEIEQFVLKYNLNWQLQYTMYKEDDEKAIYNNKHALRFLNQLIGLSKANIIKGDNMRPEGQCSAGKNSLGILANGDVIPCLSMKSWHKDPILLGNIFHASLDFIWESGFSEFRCKSFMCCKDHCNIEVDTTLPNQGKLLNIDYTDYSNIVMVYGISTQRMTTASIFPQNTNIMTYAVIVVNYPLNDSLQPNRVEY